MGTRNVSGIRKVVRGGKPRWFIDFPFTDKDGVRQRFRRDASVQSYSAALAEAARLMRRAAETGSVEESANTALRPTAMTYAQFVEGPFEELYMPTYRPATARRYRELHKQRVMAFFGSKALDAIGPGDFRAFAASLHTDGVQTKGPITLVRSVVRAAHECSVIERLPECPSGLVATSRKVADMPSSDEVDVMLRASGWLGLAIALGAMAGLRMGEARALEVRDVDFERHRILVRRAMSDEASLTPKSGHEREVPMAAGLEARLRVAAKDKLPRARLLLDDEGLTPPAATSAPSIRAVPALEWLEGALVSFAPPLLHLGADEVRRERRGRPRSGRALEAGNDPALRPCRGGRPPSGHRPARQIAPGCPPGTRARQLGDNGPAVLRVFAAFPGKSSRFVGARGFEPPTPRSRTECATRLRYAPIPPRRSRATASARGGGTLWRAASASSYRSLKVLYTFGAKISPP